MPWTTSQPEPEQKTVPLRELKVVAEGTGRFSGYASVFNEIDLVGDTVLPGAYATTLDAFVRHGFIAWGHDWDRPIATIDTAREDDRGLWIEATFHSDPDAQRARAIATERLERGKTMGLSIGYAPKDWKLRSDGVRELLEIELLETSLVTVPAEPNAQVTGIKAGGGKGAIGGHTTARAPESAAWDGPVEVRQAEGATQLRRMHAWVDSEGDPEAKSSYKLPHHRASGEVVWRGVAAAMGALMGGRGGVDLPASDEAGVRAHLAGHYRQFDKEPPPKGGQQWLGPLLEALAGEPLESETKEGRVLSARNVQRLKENMEGLRAVLQALEALLADALPTDEGDGGVPGGTEGGGKGGEAHDLNPEGLRAWAEYQRTLLRRAAASLPVRGGGISERGGSS